MERKMDEILASQQKMLNRNKVIQDTDDKTMEDLFIKHLKKVNNWLLKQKNIDVLPINYNMLVVSPESEVKKIIEFLSPTLDSENMASVVNPELYRNRS